MNVLQHYFCFGPACQQQMRRDAIKWHNFKYFWLHYINRNSGRIFGRKLASPTSNGNRSVIEPKLDGGIMPERIAYKSHIIKIAAEGSWNPEELGKYIKRYAERGSPEEVLKFLNGGIMSGYALTPRIVEYAKNILGNGKKSKLKL